MYPPLDAEQKRFLLSSMLKASSASGNADAERRTKSIVNSLRGMWSGANSDFAFKGLSSTAFNGLGQILGAIWEESDPFRIFTLNQALLSVQIAGALRCTQVPSERSSELISLGASLYSGIPRNQTPLKNEYLETIVGNLLTISSDQSPADFVRSFESSDINRLSRYVSEIASNSANIEEAAEIANAYNAEAKKYEKRREIFSKLDLCGLLVSLSTIQAANPPFIPPTTWISELLRWLLQKENSGMSSSIIDVFDSIGKTSNPRAVLVARMQKKISWPNI
ncbi:MAG: hypothetical protein EOP04_20995 [Proteobacteria bacterium]|nr:MAG: hypothetical protein EOP04_20995 [Pseudomonadota bacterium]